MKPIDKKDISILIFVASQGKNAELAKQFAQHLSVLGISPSIVDIVELGLPMYTTKEQENGTPKQAVELMDRISKANGFVFVAPEYNGGVPPTLTNLLAWLSVTTKEWRAGFNEKPAAIASFSGSNGHRLLVALRIQLSYIGMDVIGREVSATFSKPVNESSVERVCQLLLNNCLITC